MQRQEALCTLRQHQGKSLRLIVRNVQSNKIDSFVELASSNYMSDAIFTACPCGPIGVPFENIWPVLTFLLLPACSTQGWYEKNQSALDNFETFLFLNSIWI